MDTIKYMLSHVPEISILIKPVKEEDFGWRKWGERELQVGERNPRYGT